MQKTLFFLLLSLTIIYSKSCPIFPSTNIWNTPIDTLPVHPLSSQYVSSIGPTKPLHADFGAGLYDGSPMGIPFNFVNGSKVQKYKVSFDYSDESDKGPYPISSTYQIEGGVNNTGGDRHLIVLDNETCTLYELYSAYPKNNSWTAGSGAIWNLSSNNLRPLGWTSADAAGLPIYPGLVKYEEIAAGAINHAIRFTAVASQKAYVWPARHMASSKTLTSIPPMGARFRLKSSFDVSSFSKEVQIILKAMKKYGIILADNGSNWFFTGAPDNRWNNDVLASQFKKVLGSNFEAVDCSKLMKAVNSGEVKI